MKHVAWGYVTRDIGDGKELLVATRAKKDDPLRSGQLVLPGGEIEQNEHYVDTAIREVKEETGINAYFTTSKWFKPNSGQYDRQEISAYVDELGQIYLTYFDSRKEYIGRIVPLVPRDPRQAPRENPTSDAKNPEYVSLAEALRRKTEFTPAGQILLDIIHENGV